METKLRECPFCGEDEADIAKYKLLDDDGDVDEFVCVRCSWCGSTGSWEQLRDEAKAIGWWNTRMGEI